MKTALQIQFRKWILTLRARGRLVFLIFLSFIVGCVAATVLSTSQFLNPGAPTAEALCQLDSFSQPSLALAILKQESNRLLADYIQRRAPKTIGQAQSSAAAIRLDEDPLSRAELERTCDVDWPAITPIERLQSGIEARHGDLDRELMKIYFENHLWDKFLDCYLDVVETEPQSTTVITWEHCALAAAQHRGRSDELLDSLNHLTRFHPQLKTVRGVKSVLEELKIGPSDAAAPAISVTRKEQ